jgi:uncharacterized protein (UPF0332 family)
VTWKPGHKQIAELLNAGDLDHVVPDHDVARRLLTDAQRHLDTVGIIEGGGDLVSAYQLAYDALRKSAAALLAVQGLRATSRGGHLAVQRAVNAQFGSTVGAFRSFTRIRRARNTFEYPDADTPDATRDDVADAITTATKALAAATTILNQNLLTPWR